LLQTLKGSVIIGPGKPEGLSTVDLLELTSLNHLLFILKIYDNDLLTVMDICTYITLSTRPLFKALVLLF
jgi:hypothetical protein